MSERLPEKATEEVETGTALQATAEVWSVQIHPNVDLEVNTGVIPVSFAVPVFSEILPKTSR